MPKKIRILPTKGQRCSKMDRRIGLVKGKDNAVTGQAIFRSLKGFPYKQ